MKPLIPLLFFTLLFAACNNESSTTETVTEEPKRDTVDYSSIIDEANKLFAASALKGDSATFVSTLYHPDANIYPPNEASMDPKQFGSMIAQFPKMGVSSFTLNTKEIFEGDETVTEVGVFEMGDGKKTFDKGRYVVIWKKDGDKWKLFRDMWNSENAPPPPASKK